MRKTGSSRNPEDRPFPYLGPHKPKPVGDFGAALGITRELVFDASRPLPGEHQGSWDAAHKDRLVLFETQGFRAR